MDYFGFGGRPPLAPLARAASDLAAERILPPLRPKATADGFFLLTANAQRGVSQGVTVFVGRDGTVHMGANVLVAGMAQGLVFGRLVAQVVGCKAVHLTARAFRLLEQRAQALSVSGVLGAQLVRGELAKESAFVHVPIKPNRLGFVKWAN